MKPVSVEYVGGLEAVAFELDDGRVLGVLLRRLYGLDETPVTRVALVDDCDAVLVEQFSGNRVEMPWDAVLSASGSAPRR